MALDYDEEVIFDDVEDDTINEACLLDSEIYDDLLDEEECFCFNCEQDVDSKIDLVECEICERDFYICSECKEEILLGENLCIGCFKE